MTLEKDVSGFDFKSTNLLSDWIWEGVSCPFATWVNVSSDIKIQRYFFICWTLKFVQFELSLFCIIKRCVVSDPRTKLTFPDKLWKNKEKKHVFEKNMSMLKNNEVCGKWLKSNEIKDAHLNTSISSKSTSQKKVRWTRNFRFVMVSWKISNLLIWLAISFFFFKSDAFASMKTLQPLKLINQ